MNTLTDKEGKPITREKLDEIFIKIINRNPLEIVELYYSLVNQMSEALNVSKETPALEDVAAMCSVRNTTLNIVKTALCELFGIKDTPAVGEPDTQAGQSKE